ncbi:MAG: AAA family ATPase [Verrucomicrobiota bacterium]
MRLKTLRLHNFRRFKGARICEMHSGLTVFAANNGAGKSSILDAIALAFGPFLTRLPKISGNSLVDNDICIQREKDEPFALVGAETFASRELKASNSIIDDSMAWDRIKRLDPSSSIRKTQDKLAEYGYVVKGHTDINREADLLITRADSDEIFPIIAYYGPGRAVLDMPQRRRGFGKEFPRFHAYADCLNPKTNFRKLFEYFYFLEDFERREKLETKDFEYQNGQLMAVRRAITDCIPEYQNPRTKLSPLRFLLDNKMDGDAYDIRLLSDGFKTVIAMVMDIASRMVEANPDLGATALESPGIVLIDEIELHLHPSWQQRIIPDLQRTFPNVQFICTTHSPQVLSTVKQESIRVITEEGEIKTGQEMGVNSFGAQSYFILEDLMKVSPNPRIPEVENLKEVMKKRLNESEINLGDSDIQRLENMIGARDPFLLNLKAAIIKKGKAHA